MPRHQADILHQRLRVAERLRIDALKHQRPAPVLGVIIQSIGSVDVSGGQLPDACRLCLRAEGGGDTADVLLVRHGVSSCHFCLTKQTFSITTLSVGALFAAFVATALIESTVSIPATT